MESYLREVRAETTNGADALQRIITEITPHVEKIEKSGSIKELAELYMILKEANAKWDELRKEIYHMWNRLDKGVLPERFENEELDKIQIPELERSFYPKANFSASFVDKEKGYQWLRDNDLDALITETVNASTLSATIKDMILNQGKEPPADVIKTNSYNSIGSSKYTPKKSVKK